jgi:large subunit ribosomal protein L17
MRHRVKAKHFNRDSKGRKAMFKGLLSNLFEHGAIETTEARAKEIKRLADKLIHRALPGTLHARRILEQFFGSRSVVNNLVDGVAPAMKDRVSGFTRIVPLGRRRGDDATMVKIELMSKPLTKAVEAAPTVVEKAAKAVKKEISEVVEAVEEAVTDKPAKKAAAKKPAAKKETAKPAKKAAAKKSE